MKLGMNAKAYLISDWGVSDRPTWGSGTPGDDGYIGGAAPAQLDTEVGLINDTLDLNESRGQANVTTRDNGGWKATATTVRDADITFRVIYDMTDDAELVLQAVFALNSFVTMAFLDGPIDEDGSTGLYGDFQIVNRRKAEPMEDAQTIEYTLKPALGSRAPEDVFVGGSPG